MSTFLHLQQCVVELMGISFQAGDGKLISSLLFLGDRLLLNGFKPISSKPVYFPKYALILWQSSSR